ncbi:MAG: Hpt domain-containing protein, partial [Myxococcales bacterium]
FEQLRDLVDNDRSELSSLVQEYETNTRQLQQQMRESLPNQRVQELCRAAHTLKSSSALMGASGLSALCASLEEATRQGQIPADTAARIDAIDRAGAESFRWLQEQIG